MATTKLPPHSIEAEEATIGSLLIDGTAINSITLMPADFYSDLNALIFEACQALSEREVSINQITVAEELNKDGKLEEVGGVAFLTHLVANCPTSLDIVYYAEIVRRLAISRRLISASQRIAEIGYSADPDISQALDRADGELLEVRKHGVPSPIVTPRDRAELLSDRYERLAKSEEGVAIKTGLHDLDYWLGGGLYNGDMLLVGSRPSMGKTTLLQFIANGISREKNILFCSGEMSVEAISDRDVAGFTGETIGTIRLGGYSHELEGKIMGALGEISELQVYYYEDTPLTTAKILQAGIAMQLRHGLGVLMVDYLGMLDDDYGRSPYERVSFISRKLKQMARKLDVPLVVAHQLSRAVEARTDRRPQLFDLRESGKLEEDADVVLFLYREDYYYTREEWEREFLSGNDHYREYPENIVEILIAKQRQGQANKIVKVRYDTEHQVYQNLERQRVGA